MFDGLKKLLVTNVRWQPRHIRWLFWSFLLFWAVLWYIAFNQLITSEHEVNEALRHIGLAFGLAGFFGLTVDYYVKKQLTEEIIRETGPYIFTHGMPEELREEVVRARDVRLVKRDVLLELSFRKHGDYLELETTNSYSLENSDPTDHPYVHATSIAEDKHHKVVPCDITLLQAYGFDVVGGGYVLRGSEVPVERGKNPGDLAALAKKDIAIKPNVGKVRNSLIARTKTILDKQDEELYFTRIPIIGLKVRILEKPSELKIREVLVSHEPGTLVGTPTEDPSSWECRAALFAWSAIAIAWRWESVTAPVEQPAASSADH